MLIILNTQIKYFKNKMNPSFFSTLKIVISCIASFILLFGCSTTHRTTQSTRTAVEQLLISESAIRSLSQKSNELIQIPSGSKVTINISGLTEDKTFLQEVLTGWLGRQGYLIQKEEKDATYRIDVIVGALGTEEDGTFVGLPPIHSQIIPFSLPELAFYKSKNQTGYIKFNMNFFETQTNKFIGSSSSFLADSYHNKYTVLLILSFTSTDLASPPQLGFHRDKPQNNKNAQSDKSFFDWW